MVLKTGTCTPALDCLMQGCCAQGGGALDSGPRLMRGGRGGVCTALERGRQLCLPARHGGQPLLQALRQLPHTGTTSVTRRLTISCRGLPVQN
jgi:hypothetical protein